MIITKEEDKEVIRNLISCLEQALNGKEIQFKNRDSSGRWERHYEPDLLGWDCRVKPEPREFWILGSYTFSSITALKSFQTTNYPSYSTVEIIHVKEVL
jgi:hypothetical protein